MKKLFLIGIATGLVRVAAQDHALVSTNEVVLAKFLNENDTTTYSVPWERLPCKVTWRPGDEPLPLKLNQEIIRAKSFLESTGQATNRFDIESILIRRLLVSQPQLAAHRGPVVNIDDNWFTIVTFYSKDVYPEKPRFVLRKRVGMLMDGTYANEYTKAALRPQGTNAAVQPTRPETGLFDSAVQSANGRREEPNPLDELRKPDFSIPLIQWNPFGEQFPLDMDDQMTQCRIALSTRLDNSTALRLREIRLSPYVPVEAIQFQNRIESDNLHHWLLAFEFNDENSNKYEVYALLDGRILPIAISPRQKL